MKKRTLLVGITAAALFCLAIPAAAETFTSSDGVLSIELPDDSWKEMTDPAKWIALSDGSNVITIEHLSNGEKLPDITIADEHYVNVWQAAFSTQNEVFILTGAVVDAAKVQEVANAILSTKILKYDTKMKVTATTQQVSPSDITVAPVSKTMYVTSNGLNVRAGFSTDDKVIGGYAYGAAVKVTGVVQKNGADFGWYQVDYSGAAGYVSSSYLSDNAPAPKADSNQPSGITFTGTATTIYSSAGSAITIYKATDGNWYDSAGRKYTWLEDYKVSDASGNLYTTNKPVTNSNISITGTFTVYWENGNAETLTQYSDGTYYSSGNVQYYDAGGGAFAGADGTTLYTTQPQLGTAGSSLQHGLESQGSGRPVQIGSSDGITYYDESGVAYYDQGDGTYVDQNGDVFNVVW